MKMKSRELFVEECLEAHNHYRSMHGSAPLKIDKKLNDRAEERADRFAKIGEFRVAEESGENVYVALPTEDSSADPADPAEPTEPNPRDVVDSWYRVGRYYRYGVQQPGSLKDVASFTQVVWKETNFLGVGIANGADGKVYVVSVYEPAGNIEGRFATNVFPPKEMEVTEASLDGSGILCSGSPVEAVRSMERLYAVPSEKLRIWSTWIKQVCQVTIEWQRWLAGNIELLLEIGDRLQLAQESVPGPRDKKVKPGKEDGSDASYQTAVAGGIGVNPLGASSAVDQERGISHEESRKLEQKKKQRPLKEGGLKTNPAENGRDASEGEAMTVEENFWPIGTAWTPLRVDPDPEAGLADPEAGLADPDVTRKLPANQREMQDFIEEFKQQATGYRSYYRHWLKTGEQATKEIGSRLVMPTWQVQGRHIDEESFSTAEPVDSQVEDESSTERVRKDIQVDLATADMARADEEIPYFFYLKVSPDIDIAIEIDNEVREIESGRNSKITMESIMGEEKRLFFSLHDKSARRARSSRYSSD